MNQQTEKYQKPLSTKPTYEKTILNLGCGENKLVGAINVDNWGTPDFKWDLQQFPYPWADDSIDGIEMWHVLEHMPDWWSTFKECVRILKPGGYFNVRVPHESNCGALSYRDHYHIFTPQHSFLGIMSLPGGVPVDAGANSWATTEVNRVPVKMVDYKLVPCTEYQWMAKWSLGRRFLKFAADHLRNFIWEQQFYFIKVGKNEAN